MPTVIITVSLPSPDTSNRIYIYQGFGITHIRLGADGVSTWESAQEQLESIDTDGNPLVPNMYCRCLQIMTTAFTEYGDRWQKTFFQQNFPYLVRHRSTILLKSPWQHYPRTKLLQSPASTRIPSSWLEPQTDPHTQRINPFGQHKIDLD